ncbi:unnamed protein product [Arctia plantaginis]|uniref:Uncharacterized protein n=1 Tax=Arctia plantaginis TaxID=874455 RepID=A0A8S1A2N0_ARCPL|nr:unnamed protein product [Arctia plantaginis]
MTARERSIIMRYIIPATLLLCSIIGINEALRILVCFPMSSKSHSILGHGVVDRLLEANHEVVHITSFPKEKPVPNLTEINVSSIGDFFNKEAEKSEMLKLKNIIGKGNLGDTFFLMYFAYTLHKGFLEEPNVVKLLSDPKEKFDAVVMEWFFSELNVGIPHLFEAPMIWVASTEPHWQTLRLVDEIPNPAYNVDLFIPRSAPFSFWERVDQLWRIVKKFVVLKLIQEPAEWWVYNSIYPEIAA